MARAPVLQEVDVAPEADCLDGFPHPRKTERLFGHGAAERSFAEAFGAGRLHHAWLVAGRAGIGKATLAWRIARYVLAQPDERGRGEAPLDIPSGSIAERQVLALSHPGLLVIRRPWVWKDKRFMTVIPVDEVRRLKSFISHAAAPQAWRVVIVDQADELNISAANALLKSLEEPPQRTVFLLISSEPGRLLTTIRSRCRRLELAPLNESDIKLAASAAIAAADAKPIEAKDWPQLVQASQGSVRRLLAMSQGGGAGVYSKVLGLLATLPKLDWVAVHALADEVTGAGADQRFEQFFAHLQEILARLIRLRATSDGDGADERLARRLIREGSLAAWAEMWEMFGTRKAEVQGLNLDKKALILEMFAQIEAAARG